MKILLIITPYHPSQTPNTLRWMPIVEYYKQLGIETTVLTTKNRMSSEDSSIADTDIRQAGYNTLLDWFYFTFRVKKRRQIPKAQSENKHPKSGNQFLQKFIDSTWRKYYWPDGSMLFLKPGIKKATEIIRNDKNITHVISVGLPFTCHMIAAQIKENNPHVHWHQDIEDPFSYSDEFWVNNFHKYRKNNIDAERRAFSLSDSISVTNNVAMEKYVHIFPYQAHKLSVIYPLFSEYDKSKSVNLNLEDDKLHIGFFGSFYEKVRSPKPLLELLDTIRKENPEQIRQWHFHFFGQQSKFSIPIFESFPKLESHLTLHGLLERDLSIAAMKKMDFLLNVGNTTDYHLPSKVVDFLYINKPLINVLTSKSDASVSFLKDELECCNLYVNEKKYSQLSTDLIRFIEKDRQERGVSEKNIADYKTSVIAQKYLQAMDAIHQPL